MELAKMHIWSLPMRSSLADRDWARKASVRVQLCLSARHAIERTPCQPVTLASLHSCLRCVILELLCEIERTVYDRAHIGIHSSTLTCNRAHHWPGSTLKLPINIPSCIFRKLTFWEAPLRPETLCSSLCNPSKCHLFY